MKLSRIWWMLIVLLLITVSGYALLNRNIIRLRIQKDTKSLVLDWQISRGFGVQKKGPHKVQIFHLKNGHQNEIHIKNKIKKYGKKIPWTVQFSGVTARQDEHYYSLLKPNRLNKKKFANGDYALSARIYYCSFVDGFCSVQTIYKMLH